MFFGEGGTGKNTLVDRVLYTLFARQTVSADAHKVLGKFNKIIQGKTVVMINEIKAEDVDPNALKGLLQQERIPMEPNGRRPVRCRQHAIVFHSVEPQGRGCLPRPQRCGPTAQSDRRAKGPKAASDITAPDRTSIGSVRLWKRSIG